MENFDNTRHDAFLRLYAEHEDALRGFVRSLVPTLEDARDVMQEVAAVLWQKFEGISSPQDFRPWAFGVARLEALQFRRTRARDRHVFGDDLLQQLADDSEAELDRFEEERHALETCLQKLTSAQRALVEQAYAPGVRIDELAVRMNRTAMSLYKVLHRIRTALVECTTREMGKKRFA